MVCVFRRQRTDVCSGDVAEEQGKRFPGTTNTLDGIRIDMETAWIHLRSSNTEPVVRIIAEAGVEEETLSFARGTERSRNRGAGPAYR